MTAAAPITDANPTVAEMEVRAARFRPEADRGLHRLGDSSLRYIIHDFSTATEVIVPQIDIEFMAVRASVALLWNPKVKIAFVGNHPVVHALIDAFDNLGPSPHRCHRFDALDEARAFIAA